MELEQYEKMAEAILFAGGEPVEQKTVAAAMELDEEAAVTVLESLLTKYEKFSSSIEVLRLDTQWQLCTKKEYEPYIRSAFEISATLRFLRRLWRCLRLWRTISP